jgi:UDP-glucose 4-epimerase
VRILLTGGAGFIGSHVCDRLIEDGHELIVLDDLSSGRVEQLNARARFYQMDLLSPWLTELFKIERPEAVVHQAAQASVRQSVRDPVGGCRVNVLGTVALLEASLRHGIRRFVMASTGGALYGDGSPVPTPEEGPCAPVSPYGASKLAAEEYLETFRALHGLSTLSLRYANVYGPRQDPLGEAGVVAIFAQRLLKGEPAVINGDGRQTRDYVYVSDVAEANALALASTETGAFNVGTGEETDVNTIFRFLRELTGSSQAEKHGPSLAGEQRRSAVDSSKIRRALGWQPRTGLREGLSATVSYFKKQPAGG